MPYKPDRFRALYAVSLVLAMLLCACIPKSPEGSNEGEGRSENPGENGGECGEGNAGERGGERSGERGGERSGERGGESSGESGGENASLSPIVWPISGTAQPDGPLSSTFGPRLKASEDFRYDFHRGIDIPTPIGSAVYAVADGRVRIAGDHDSYSDMLVQLVHDAEAGGTFYSNYVHLSGVSVEEDQAVTRGELVGQSGAGASGFAHLHFETRDGGLYQRDCVSPFVFLPYGGAAPPAVSIDTVDTAAPGLARVTVTVSKPRIDPSDALDFNAITVSTWQDDGKALEMLDSHTYDMTAWNLAYTPLPPEDANVNMDNPEFNGVLVAPAELSSRSEFYEVQFTFTELLGPEDPASLAVTAVAEDLRGQKAEVRYP